MNTHTDNRRNVANFDQIFTFWGDLVPISLADMGQNLAIGSRPRSILTCQISFESVYFVTFHGRKTANLCKFRRLGSFMYPATFTNEGQIWYIRVLLLLLFIYHTTINNNRSKKKK